MYDAQIWRTLTFDPLCEMFYNTSQYAFLNNNPLSFLDPTGAYPVYVNGEYSHSIENGQRVDKPEDAENHKKETNPFHEFDLDDSCLGNMVKVVGTAISNFLFDDKAEASGETHKVISKEAYALAQTPVAYIVSGNLAAQMYTGGVDVSAGIVVVVSGEDKGVYVIVDGGVSVASTGFSAGASVMVTPVFFSGEGLDFRVKNLEGNRLEFNSGILGTPIVTGGFKSLGTRPEEATWGFYLGGGKSFSVKKISTEVPFQMNVGHTNVLGR
jgi:hypothetical protein